MSVNDFGNQLTARNTSVGQVLPRMDFCVGWPIVSWVEGMVERELAELVVTSKATDELSTDRSEGANQQDDSDRI